MGGEGKLYCGHRVDGKYAVHCNGNWIDTDYSCSRPNRCRFCMTEEEFKKGERGLAMEIDNMSKQELEELKKKVNVRMDAIRDAEVEEEREKARKVLVDFRDHKEFLLRNIEHSCTSCSDTNLDNGYSTSQGRARCPKCHLMEILDGYWDAGDFEITLSVMLTEIKK